MNQNRQPPGIPVGGQFAPGGTARSSVTLGAAPAPSDGPAAPVFYRLPADRIVAGMSTADGQDFLEDVGDTGNGWVGASVYTPSDDPDQDEEYRNDAEYRMYRPDEMVDLAVFENTEISPGDLGGLDDVIEYQQGQPDSSGEPEIDPAWQAVSDTYALNLTASDIIKFQQRGMGPDVVVAGIAKTAQAALADLAAHEREKQAPVRQIDGGMRETIARQITRGNILAISGGRITALPDGIELPVSNGYRVRVRLAGNDTYTVQRVLVRGAREYDKGTRTDVYADQVGEQAYRASCFRSYEPTEW